MTDGTLAERKAEELGRFERTVENEIAEAHRRSLSAVEIVAILRDYADDLERADRVPPAWGGT